MSQWLSNFQSFKSIREFLKFKSDVALKWKIQNEDAPVHCAFAPSLHLKNKPKPVGVGGSVHLSPPLHQLSPVKQQEQCWVLPASRSSWHVEDQPTCLQNKGLQLLCAPWLLVQDELQ